MAVDFDPKEFADIKEREYLRQKATAQVKAELQEEEMYDLFSEYPIGLLEPYTVDEILSLPPVEYLIDLYVVRGTLGIVASAAGAGKSFWMLDQACRLAMQGFRVLYLALEGLYSMMERVSAWLRSYPLNADRVKANLVFNNIEWPGLDVKEKQSVEWHRQMIDACGPFDLVVIDNLNRAGYDEEDNPGSAAVVRCMDAFLKTRGVASSNGSVVAVHNFGWYAKRIRGGSKLRDGVDTSIYMEVVQTADQSAQGSQVSRLWSDKMKRGNPFPDSWFELRVVELGAPVGATSCVPVGCEKPKSEGNKYWVKLVEVTLVNTVKRTEPEAWITAKDFGNVMGCPAPTATKELNKLVAGCLAIRRGAGGKKDPYQWQAMYLGEAKAEDSEI